MKNKDKILLGECISPSGMSDRCPHCIDKCEAFDKFITLQTELNKNRIKRPLK